MKPCVVNVVKYLLIILGVFFLLSGVSLQWFLFPSLLEFQILQKLHLVEDSEQWNAFITPPVPVYMKFYPFNINNPGEVKNGLENVSLSEYGPYVYQEVMIKQDVVRSDIKSISYSKYTEYHFDYEQSLEQGCKSPSGSPCQKTDVFTIVNIPLLTISSLLKPLLGVKIGPLDIGNILVDLFNSNLASTANFSDDLFHNASIDDLLYTGYSFGLVKFISALPLEIAKLLEIKPEQINALIPFLIPPQLSNSQFAVFKGKNATKLDNYYTIDNGVNNINDFLTTLEINGRSSLPKNWWPDVASRPSAQYSGLGGLCHKLTGSDGTQFPPFLNKDKRIWLFVADLCRPIWMVFTEEVEIQGLTVYRYRAAPELFNMSDPNNYCYCTSFHKCAVESVNEDEWDFSGCEDECKSGLLDVSGCYGAPILMSQPHFLNANPSLLNNIIGLKPNPEYHDTILDVDPTVGITVNAHKRLQINIRMRPFKEMELLSKVKDVTLPVFWVDEGSSVDKDNAQKLKSSLYTPKLLVKIYGIGCGLVLGPLFIIAFVILSLWQK